MRAAARPRPDAVGLPDVELPHFDEIYDERDACGVGFISSVKGKRSHKIVADSLAAVGCMEHRGACSADAVSGDGVGIMTEIPWDLIREDVPAIEEGSCGVAMTFLPDDDGAAAAAMALMEEKSAAEGFEVLGWRDVPTDASVVGRIARDTLPRVKQLVVRHPTKTGDDLERALYLVRKQVETEEQARVGDPFPEVWDEGFAFYICSFTNKTIIYKGMLNSNSLGPFFLDLQNAAYQTAYCIYHRRFSTNTNPKWPLAQPMRMIGHNGEINTLQGNLNWVFSRERSLTHPVWEGRESEFGTLCNGKVSDSANLDRVIELMVRSGYPLEKAMMILVPEAYRNHPDLVEKYPDIEPFYEFYEGYQEGWDGPALLVFSDGKKIGARLDRNGLRPARFWRVQDGDDDIVYVASEVGVLNDTLETAPNVVNKGRLGPGQMVVTDIERNTFEMHEEVAKRVAADHPYREWAKSTRQIGTDFGDNPYQGECLLSPEETLQLQTAFGYGLEDSQLIIENMASAGIEATYCMGDDIPLSILSERPHMLYDYFKQRFAQVTNPPIDPLREGLVMSLEMRLGRRGNLLDPTPEDASQINLPSPVLIESELECVRGDAAMQARTFSLAYEAGKIEAALDQLCLDAEAAVDAGCQVTILSDKIDAAALDQGKPMIPALLATGAVHHHLIKKAIRTETSIVTETAQCFSTHHMAVLVGYGASAVCPWLALEAVRQWRASPKVENMVKKGKMEDLSLADVQNNFRFALNKGLKKILSKMGISLLACYHGAQIFEIYGLSEAAVAKAFNGSTSRVGGLTIPEIGQESEKFWAKAFGEGATKKLEFFGFLQSRPAGEYHANNPEMSKLLHKAIGLGNADPVPESYAAFLEHMDNKPVTVLRDMVMFKSDRKPISVDQVEPASEIVKRFCTGGMSLGAISQETHETIAIAMNRIGGKSNSGEGGEDPIRWEPLSNVDAEGRSETFSYLPGLANGDIATSRIKQVASGRFGVTPEFLVNADQLEIKVAQGAKPGEGGQLPGKKVSPYIASLRRSKPGVTLISPPPHHDIYGIEDLAQLIYDLHQVNPTAKVSVKLVAEAGIGTIASGVAKANADIIQVSGHDGGTGASPVSSIKHAGGPMEMGLSETHRVLMQNELREQVVVRADGGLRSGRDVLMCAAMGADEYGFGTIAMIATGCVMARICHTNNCPVGVASQREELRARYPGAPSDVVNFFLFIAEEVRAGLAAIGYKSLDELIGRTDLLVQRDHPLGKTENFDASFLTEFQGRAGPSSARIANEVRTNGPQLDDDILAMPEVLAAIEEGTSCTVSETICNRDRAFPARVSGRVAKKWGDNRFPNGATEGITINLQGAAGQSFGAFGADGMHINLEGEANDYCCKGIAGGSVAIFPPKNAGYAPEGSSIVGNTALYGATGGKVYLNGRAGERFCVRNSFAEAVVEGTGDHCCEYMTGGVVVALGTVGRNVGAGMTGGLGYFLDEEGTFPSKVNSEIVSMQRVITPAGEAQLKGLITEHVARTGSPKGQRILDAWATYLPQFWQVVPPSEQYGPEASLEAEQTADVTADVKSR